MDERRKNALKSYREVRGELLVSSTGLLTSPQKMRAHDNISQSLKNCLCHLCPPCVSGYVLNLRFTSTVFAQGPRKGLCTDRERY